MTALEERSNYIGLMTIPTAIGNIMGPIIGALFSMFTEDGLQGSICRS